MQQNQSLCHHQYCTAGFADGADPLPAGYPSESRDTQGVPVSVRSTKQ